MGWRAANEHRPSEAAAGPQQSPRDPSLLHRGQRRHCPTHTKPPTARAPAQRTHLYMRFMSAVPSKMRLGSLSSSVSSVRAALRILDSTIWGVRVCVCVGGVASVRAAEAACCMCARLLHCRGSCYCHSSLPLLSVRGDKPRSCRCCPRSLLARPHAPSCATRAHAPRALCFKSGARGSHTAAAAVAVAAGAHPQPRTPCQQAPPACLAHQHTQRATATH
jgi:hypothetical protein